MASVLLVHPTGYYVANTGDCRIVLGSAVGPETNSELRVDPLRVGATPLSEDQTGATASEVARLQKEHPGEQVVYGGRILGGLQPSRAFGDSHYKWSRERLQEVKRRSRDETYATPPYVTARPEVVYQARHPTDRFIILATDGLWDVLPNELAVELAATAMNQPPASTNDLSNDTAPVASFVTRAALAAYAERVNLSLQKLVEYYLPRDVRDDITTTVVKLQFPPPPAAAESFVNVPPPAEAKVPTPLQETLMDVYKRTVAKIKAAAGS